MISIGWTSTAALWGLGLIAIPIAIHLLVRHQTRTVAYPSLRFVEETALAAFRRRAIQDALLLACRVTIVAAAALALAGPIVHTPGRIASYAQRVSRAIVQLDDDPAPRQSPFGEAFRTQTFRRSNVADTLADATRWLDAQPPSSREIVVVGAFRKGQFAKSDLLLIRRDIGVRFLPSTTRAGADQFTQRMLTRRDGHVVLAHRTVRLATDSTRIEEADATMAPDDVVRIIAAAKDQRLADAALTAALDAGLRWPNPERRVVVVWQGAESAPAKEPTVDVIRMPVPDPAVTAATAVWKTIDAATPIEAAEPTTIAPADLDAWTRPSGGVSPAAPPIDEGDRKWLWGLALVLLTIESWLRRHRGTTAHSSEEHRVA